MNAPFQRPSSTIHVPGELRWGGLVWVLILFLVVDGVAYFIAAKMFRRYQAAVASTSEQRFDELVKRLDSIETQLRSVSTDLSNATAAANAATKQSQAALDGVRQLEKESGGSRRRSKK